MNRKSWLRHLWRFKLKKILWSPWSIQNNSALNPLTAKLFIRNFHSLEAVSRWRDPQLQVSENHSDLTKLRSTLFKSFHIMALTCLKGGTECDNNKVKNGIYSAPAVKELRSCILINYFPRITYEPEWWRPCSTLRKATWLQVTLMVQCMSGGKVATSSLISLNMLMM